MRLIARLFGRAFLTLAGMAFLTGASLFVVGSFLITWPILRLPPRDRRMKAGLDVAAALVEASIALRDKALQPDIRSEEVNHVSDV